jgi:hypothetical protein
MLVFFDFLRKETKMKRNELSWKPYVQSFSGPMKFHYCKTEDSCVDAFFTTNCKPTFSDNLGQWVLYTAVLWIRDKIFLFFAIFKGKILNIYWIWDVVESEIRDPEKKSSRIRILGVIIILWKPSQKLFDHQFSFRRILFSKTTVICTVL